MSNIPKKLEYGEHKGKTYCTQYACLNNYGYCRSKIQDSSYPYGCCNLDNPNVNDFGNGIWGCGDERYGNEVRK